MSTSLFAPLLTAILATTPQDAQTIINRMQEKQAERWETVENYTVIQSAFGIQTPMHYEKVLVGDDNKPMFRRVSASNGEQPPGGGQRMTGQMADAYELMADSMEGQPGMQGTGGMFRDMSSLMRGAGAAETPDTRPDAARRARDMNVFAERARLVGRETIDGRDAFHLRAENLSDLEYEEAGGSYTVNAMSMWVDTEEYVTLRLKIEGEVDSEGQRRPLVLEKLDQDFRHVGPMYEPHRMVMRISGLQEALDPKQQAELERARAQMEQLKAQLAEMPEAQRRLIEGRMQSSMEMLERMTGGDGSLFETVIEIEEIRINAGPPTTGTAGNGLGHAAAAAGDGQRAAESERSAARADRPAGREDLERFAGLYGDPNAPDQRRTLFVTESCNGQLVVGAMWGDASNWWMTSTGDTKFEMSDQFRSLSLEFDVNTAGNAIAMRHDLDGLPNPLTRMGPLPDEYGDCIRDTRG